MNIANTKLPIHLIPLKDELLSCYLLRMAKRYKTKYHTLCSHLFEYGNTVDVIDIDLTISEHHEEILLQKTYLNSDQIRNLTLKNLIPNLVLSLPELSFWSLSRGKYHRTDRNNYISFCPGCLKTDPIPYYRTQWRLITSVCCPNCGYLLLDECPNCENPISYHRLDVGRKESILLEELCICYNCAFDFRNSNAVTVDKEILHHQLIINNLLVNGFSKKHQYAHLFFKGLKVILDMLNSQRDRYNELHLFLDKKFGFTTDYTLKKRPTSIRNLNLEARFSLMQKAFYLSSLDFNSFTTLLINSGISSSYLLRDTKIYDVPYWLYKYIREGLTIKYTDWKDQYPNLNYLSSYKVLGETLIRKSS